MDPTVQYLLNVSGAGFLFFIAIWLAILIVRNFYDVLVFITSGLRIQMGQILLNGWKPGQIYTRTNKTDWWWEEQVNDNRGKERAA